MWVLVMFYFDHMADTAFIGRFHTQQMCITAMVKANPEMPADAMRCIKFEDKELRGISHAGNR